MIDIHKIGNRIKELRKKHGLTQQDFAHELHVSFQAVSNWERGIAPPELENLVHIANRFGVLIDDLIHPSSDNLLLGIDGGGTKTEFVVTTLDGHVINRFITKGSNPNDIGVQNALKIICDGISKALVDSPSISTVFGGVAGISTGDHLRQMTQYLKEKFPSLKIHLQTDSANLFAIDDNADMIVISGTGSVVFVRDKQKKESYIRLGGYGYLFDNAGSAYDIGRDAVSVALSEEDSIEKPGLISKLVRKKLGVSKVWDAVDKLYNGGKPYIAALSEIVFEAYLQEDSKAFDIIDRNTKRLGELLNLGISKYNAKPQAIAGGGMFEHYSHIMLPHLKKYTDTKILLSDLPAVYGACRQSRKIADDYVPKEFYENFKNTYGEFNK